MIFTCECGLSEEMTDAEVDAIAREMPSSSVRLITHTHLVNMVDAVTGKNFGTGEREVVCGEIRGTLPAETLTVHLTQGDRTA